MRNALSIALFFLVAWSGATQQEIRIHDGFMKVEDYLHVNRQKQEGYAIGIVDGIMLAPVFGASEKGQKLKSFENCVEGMSDTHVKTIIDAYMEGYSDRWNDPMHAMVLTAIMQACLGK